MIDAQALRLVLCHFFSCTRRGKCGMTDHFGQHDRYFFELPATVQR